VDSGRNSSPPRDPEELILGEVKKAAQNRKYRMSRHADQRSSEREIYAMDIEQVLTNGRRDREYDRYVDPHGWTYAFRGRDFDGKRRIRVAQGLIKQQEITVLIITVIDLDRED
jgi:hypothetical protein